MSDDETKPRWVDLFGIAPDLPNDTTDDDLYATLLDRIRDLGDQLNQAHKRIEELEAWRAQCTAGCVAERTAAAWRSIASAGVSAGTDGESE